MSQAHRIGLVEARTWVRPRSRPAVDSEPSTVLNDFIGAAC